MAVSLAALLEHETSGLTGPRVPSDRHLRSGSRVSYRYGAFTPSLARSLAGEMLEMYPGGPGGELIPDKRLLTYQPPDGIEDPFVCAELAEPLVKAEHLVADRYLVLTVLSTSRGRRVLSCFDLDRREPVVLKECTLADEIGVNGLEPRDYLSREYEAMGKFASTGHFPRPYDRFEYLGRLFVSMEYITSLSLDQFMMKLAITGHLPGWEMIRRIMARICYIVMDLHKNGFVHGDLKSRNIMISENIIITIIDLETVVPSGFVLPRGAGTRGYINDRRNAGLPVADIDDVYALGAILYLLCTGIEPSVGPGKRPLTSRPLSMLRSDLPVAARAGRPSRTSGAVCRPSKA
jgi:hypothetical protein